MTTWPNILAALMVGLGGGLGLGLAWRRAPGEDGFARAGRASLGGLAGLLGPMAVPACVLEPDGVISWSNGAFNDLAGAEGRGHRWASLLEPAVQPEAERVRAEATREARGFTFLARLGGRTQAFRASLFTDRAGRSRYLTLLFDVEAQVSAEESLRHEATRLKDVAEAIPQLVWRTDLSGAANYVNQNFLDYVGYKPEELYGWGWASVIHPEDRPRVLSEWQRARVEGRNLAIEFRVKSVHRDYRWFVSHVRPYQNAEGTVDQYYGTWTDIDEFKKVQQDLERALATRDEFISLASHELKTPITSMKMQTQMLDRIVRAQGAGAVNPVQFARMLQLSNQSLDRLNRLVDDMLDVSRLGGGGLTLERGPVDLNEEVRLAADRFADRLTASGSRLDLDLAPDVRGQWDGFRLEQVINNLLGNAIKYGRGRPIRISTRREGGDAVLTVADEGIGVSADAHDRIFERYERAASLPHTVGLGLGLYIARKIVALHGGAITVESREGAGAKFEARWPCIDRG